ncbi:MAG: NAD(+) diphosphatase [Rhodanobacteraceae bacterium]
MSADLPGGANVFAALALERNAEQRDDAMWLAGQLADSRARFLVLGPNGDALAQADASALHLLDIAEQADLDSVTPPTYLGADQGGPYFTLRLNDGEARRVAESRSGRFLDLRSAGACLHVFQAGLFAYARALSHWQSQSRYCPSCAAPLRLVAAGHRAICSDARCAIEHFPRVDPAVIMIVSHEDACLLGRQASWPERRYSTLAGFVEPGESLEDAVRREVHEEAGIEVDQCEYHSSQPWPFPSSLMIGFSARARNRTIRLGSELSDARWFTVDDVVREIGSGELRVSSSLSVSYRLIEHWLRHAAGLKLADLVAQGPQSPG